MRRWTAEEDLFLAKTDGTPKKLGLVLNRTPAAIVCRQCNLRKRGIDIPRHRRGPRPIFDWAACGTSAQYRKHLLHKIPVCEACRRAENRRVQDRQKKSRKVPGEPISRMIC